MKARVKIVCCEIMSPTPMEFFHYISLTVVWTTMRPSDILKEKKEISQGLSSTQRTTSNQGMLRVREITYFAEESKLFIQYQIVSSETLWLEG